MKKSLQQLLASDQLPSLPQVALRIIQLVQEREPDFGEITKVIKSDPAICAKLLRTANSAVFGLRQRVTSVEAAVPILGANLVKTIVLSFTLADQQIRSHDHADEYQRHWRRSLFQAVAAESLALETQCADPALVFTIGLLQDIGELAMLNAIPQEYATCQASVEPGDAQCDVEVAQHGFSHVDVGVALCERWGLETSLVEAVKSHHEPFPRNKKKASRIPSLVKLSMASARCADFLEAVGGIEEVGRTDLDQILNESYSLSDDAVFELFRDILLRVNEISALFLIDIGTPPSNDDLLRNSKSMLETLAVEGQMEAMAASVRVEHIGSKLRQLESQREQLRNEANRDALTGAYNRRYMATALRMEMQQCADSETSLGLLFADVDHFKSLNDTYGHDVGDMALRDMAETLHSSIRESDIVIRYGGDEFLVLLVDVTRSKLRQISRRICRQIRKARINGDQRIRITSSVGAILYTPRTGSSLEPDALVREVDHAMYEAKRQGGNRAHIRVTPAADEVSPMAVP